MNIFPAIDLYDKKAVRLLKGDYSKMTVYSDDPLKVAQDMEKKGAKFIHMVDLEGAKNGDTPNLSVVRQVAQGTSLFVEIGGGIRSIETVVKYFECGVDRVIIGTAAVTDEVFLKKAVERYGEKIAVSADVRDGYIAIKGWCETSQVSLEDFMDRMQQIGVKTMICTDISKDGAMKGTNLNMYNRLCERYNMRIVASGGVSDMKDVETLAGMNIYGAIIGKAYYTGAIDLTKAIEVAE